MVPELGNLALVLALCMAVVQAVFPLWGTARGVPAWMAVARPAANAQFGFLTVALVALAYAFYVSDFSVAFVAENSNRALPWYYRLTVNRFKDGGQSTRI